MSGADNLRGAPGRRFQKGVSGNPGGRTKAAHAMQRLVPTLISELTHGGADLVYMLLRIAAGAEPGMTDAKSRAWAIRELLDRNLGRPALSLKVEAGPISDTPPIDDRELTDDELRVLSKLDGAVPAKVLKLVPVPATATEAPGDGDGGSAG
jgi:hypothetical protein